MREGRHLCRCCLRQLAEEGGTARGSGRRGRTIGWCIIIKEPGTPGNGVLEEKKRRTPAAATIRISDWELACVTGHACLLEKSTAPKKMDPYRSQKDMGTQEVLHGENH